MCRLFGLHAGGLADPEFWLLDAPDSLDAQSHRNPDGAGIGCFGPDGPRVDSSPSPPGRTPSSPGPPGTCVAARSWPTSGTPVPAPARWPTPTRSLQDGRLFAHNGVVQGLDRLDRSTPFPPQPRQLLGLADLDPAAAASQHEQPGRR